MFNDVQLSNIQQAGIAKLQGVEKLIVNSLDHKIARDYERRAKISFHGRERVREREKEGRSVSLIFKFRTARRDKSRRDYPVLASCLYAERVAVGTRSPRNYNRSGICYIAVERRLKLHATMRRDEKAV